MYIFIVDVTSLSLLLCGTLVWLWVISTSEYVSCVTVCLKVMFTCVSTSLNFTHMHVFMYILVAMIPCTVHVLYD